jgi:NitT/TauT family transport system ATP-binding protein
MVFQEFDQLLPWKTVKQNITFALLNGGQCRSQKEANAVAAEHIRKVKLDRFENTYPHMLSGGMKQRVAIARGMAMEPDILLMDEPFAALDALTRLQMQKELLQLWEETRFTVLFVTHSIEEALIIGSRILVLSPHPGQVKAELNAHTLSHHNVGSSEFVAVQQRIHDMLFADRILEDEKAAEAHS